MKTITMNKLAVVKNTDAETLAAGAVAYQVIEFIINYFGSEIVTSHDTRIMEDGSQFVIGGCGFIPHDYEVK